MKKTARLVMLMRMKDSLQFRVSGVLLAGLLLAGCGTMRSSVVVEPAAGQGHGTYASAGTAAASRAAGASYVVVRGDTMYSIAFRNGVDFRDLAQWNGIQAPYTIWPGQRLSLSAAAARSVPAASAGSSQPASASVAVAPPFEPVTTPTAPTATTDTSTTVATGPATTPTPEATVPVAGVPTPAPAAVPPPAPAAPGVARVVSNVHWRWPADGKLTGKFNSADAIPGIEIGGKSGDPVRAAADGMVVYSGNGLVGYGELVIIKHNDSFLDRKSVV